MSRYLLCLVLAAILSAGRLKAGQLSTLIPESDAIVAGTDQSPIWKGNVLSFYIQVDRVFTGEIPTGSTVPVDWDSGRHGLDDGLAPHRGIWFLKKGAGDVWQCLPAQVSGNVTLISQLSFPISATLLPTALQYAADAPLMDRLVFEIAASHPSDASRILAAMGDTSSPAVLQSLRYLAASVTFPDLRIAGLIGLISRSDTQALLTLEKISATLTPGTWGPNFLINAVSMFNAPDPIATAALGRMATSTTLTPTLRSQALYALRCIHTAETLPWLAPLLDDPDPKVQYYAAQGFSFFANGLGIITLQSGTGGALLHRQPSPYRTPETERHSMPEVDFWKSWWAQHPELHTRN